MDFNKPICAVVEGDDESKKLREYFVEHGIAFRVIIEGFISRQEAVDFNI